MSIDLVIEYKDPDRKAFYHPFSAQQVLRECWWPLAERLGLETLGRMEDLFITDRAEAELLLAEFRVVQNRLQQPGQTEVPPDDAAYMLLRLGMILPAIEQAITEWDQVKELSL